MSSLTTRGEQSIPSYLLKLLTAIVIAAKGELRIPIQALAEAQMGTGITTSYDPTTKEVVLRHQPEGSEVFFIKEGPWQSRATPGSASPQPPQPPAEAGYPTVRLTDEMLAAMEEERERNRRLREFDHLPSTAIRR